MLEEQEAIEIALLQIHGCEIFKEKKNFFFFFPLNPCTDGARAFDGGGALGKNEAAIFDGEENDGFFLEIERERSE